MKHDFFIQDPSNDDTKYLYEVIVEQFLSKTLISWRAIFAFATFNGINSLLSKEHAIKAFLQTGETDIIVGLDAVTDIRTLQLLKAFEDGSSSFNAKVFHNDISDLFHPKILRFKHNDGTEVVIVGSGNFTPGGLKNNIEAFAVFEGKEKELVFLREWDDFVERHKERIRSIDQKAFDTAKENSTRQKRKKHKEAEPEDEDAPTIENSETVKDVSGQFGAGPVLVARVPAAGGRWNQIHYNRNIIDSFFKVKPDSSQRIYLRAVNQAGSLGDEEIRPLVLSKHNMNCKIEASARHGEPYPSSPPIIIIEKVRARYFLYTIIFPNEPGYIEMFDLTKDKKRALGKGFPRIITNMSEIQTLWPGCPLAKIPKPK